MCMSFLTMTCRASPRSCRPCSSSAKSSGQSAPASPKHPTATGRSTPACHAASRTACSTASIACSNGTSYLSLEPARPAPTTPSASPAMRQTVLDLPPSTPSRSPRDAATLRLQPEINRLFDHRRLVRPLDAPPLARRLVRCVDDLQHFKAVFAGFDGLLKALHNPDKVLHLLREAV